MVWHEGGSGVVFVVGGAAVVALVTIPSERNPGHEFALTNAFSVNTLAYMALHRPQWKPFAVVDYKALHHKQHQRYEIDPIVVVVLGMVIFPAKDEY